MSRQSLAAVGLVGAAVLAVAARLILSPETFATYFVGACIGSLASAVAGAVIIMRHGQATVGWLLIASGVGAMFSELANVYAYQGLVEAPGPSPVRAGPRGSRRGSGAPVTTRGGSLSHYSFRTGPCRRPDGECF